MKALIFGAALTMAAMAPAIAQTYTQPFGNGWMTNRTSPPLYQPPQPYGYRGFGQ